MLGHKTLYKMRVELECMFWGYTGSLLGGCSVERTCTLVSGLALGMKAYERKLVVVDTT
jgi:hypothetical protein